MQFAVFHDRGEGFLLDGSGAELDAVEHGGVEDVDAGVDAVAHKLDRFLHESINPAGVVGLVDDDAVFARLLHLRHHDRAFLSVLCMELGQLLEGIFTYHIRVQHEEGLVVFAQYLLGELQWACGAQWFCLDGELDVDAVLFLVLFQCGGHDFGPVVDGEHDVGDACCGECFDLVGDHGPIAEFDERFGQGEGERAEAGAKAADEDKSWDCMSIVWMVAMLVAHLSSLQATTDVKYRVQTPRKLQADQFKQRFCK